MQSETFAVDAFFGVLQLRVEFVARLLLSVELPIEASDLLLFLLQKQTRRYGRAGHHLVDGR